MEGWDGWDTTGHVVQCGGAALDPKPSKGAQIMFGSGKTHPRAEEPRELLQCSFCQKNQDHVRKLIAGPTVFICEECVQICVDIIKHDARPGASSGEAPEDAEARAGAAAERMNRDHAKQPRVDLDVPSWHVRCPLCEMVVPTEGAVPIAGRGVLCRPCVVAIRETALQPA